MMQLEELWQHLQQVNGILKIDVQQFIVVGMQEINPSERKWNTNGYPLVINLNKSILYLS